MADARMFKSEHPAMIRKGSLRARWRPASKRDGGEGISYFAAVTSPTLGRGRMGVGLRGARCWQSESERPVKDTRKVKPAIKFVAAQSMPARRRIKKAAEHEGHPRRRVRWRAPTGQHAKHQLSSRYCMPERVVKQFLWRNYTSKCLAVLSSAVQIPWGSGRVSTACRHSPGWPHDA